MFTGIVEEVGEVLSFETRDDMVLWDGSRGTGTEMVIGGEVVMDGAYLGCSICVNGVCLTATELDFESGTFRVGLAPETLRRTDLGSYVGGNGGGRRKVNLERASEIGGRNSGHFVQGHVDGVGTIVDRWADENSLFFKVSLPDEHMRYVVPKGFVAIDGASLTVCDVGSPSSSGGGWFTFMLVEYTQKKIIIPDKVVGDTVNVEVDVLGKYSERAWGAFVPKMEALERKVRELENKVTRLEGGDGGGGGGDDNDDDATVGVAAGGAILEADPIEYGNDVAPAASSSSAAAAAAAAAGERWVRAEQEFFPEGKDLNPTRENRDPRGTGTEWVRTRQTFYDTNY
jgi:riboflavin synthase